MPHGHASPFVPGHRCRPTFGTRQAGHPAGHARLGVAEDRLDALCGTTGVIDGLAQAVTLRGKVKGAARRAVTTALAIRLVLLMTLMPADYAEVMAALLGDLAAVPWQRPYQLPTATVFSAWREALGLWPLERLREVLLAAIDAEHQAQDYRAVTVGDLVCDPPRRRRRHHGGALGLLGPAANGAAAPGRGPPDSGRRRSGQPPPVCAS